MSEEETHDALIQALSDYFKEHLQWQTRPSLRGAKRMRSSLKKIRKLAKQRYVETFDEQQYKKFQIGTDNISKYNSEVRGIPPKKT